MTKLPRLADALRDVLGRTANRLARRTGFVRRQRKLTGAAFVQALVFGWLDDPDAPLSHLADTAAAVGCPVAAQSLHARFSETAAGLLEAVLERAIGVLVCGPAVTEGLLARFDGVDLIDATVIARPDIAAVQWPGVGGSTPADGRAALKVDVRLGLTDGAITASMMPGRHHDQRGPLAHVAVSPGALQVADLGYFSLERFAEIGAAGAFWLSRLRVGTVLADASGARLRGAPPGRASTCSRPPRRQTVSAGSTSVSGCARCRAVSSHVACRMSRAAGRRRRAPSPAPPLGTEAWPDAVEGASGAVRVDSAGDERAGGPAQRRRGAGALPGAVAGRVGVQAVEVARWPLAQPQREPVAGRLRGVREAARGAGGALGDGGRPVGRGISERGEGVVGGVVTRAASCGEPVVAVASERGARRGRARASIRVSGERTGGSSMHVSTADGSGGMCVNLTG